MIRRGIIVGAISALALVAAIVLAFVLNRKSPEDTSSAETPETSSQPEQSGVSEESGEESGEEPAETMVVLTFGRDALPAASLPRTAEVLPGDETVFGKLSGYEGEFPFIAQAFCGERGDCCLLIVYGIEKTGDGCSVRYEWHTVDFRSRAVGGVTDETGEPFVYNPKENNEAGRFALEFDDPEGKKGPYVLYYETESGKKLLQYGEEPDVTARILRQNDRYVVLSLAGEETFYYVIDSDGNTVAELGWDADIAARAPLMFYRDALVCKLDANDDFVYDSVGLLDLKTGETEMLLSVGECLHWTFSADGNTVAVYGKEDDEASLQCFCVSDLPERGTAVAQRIPTEQPVEWAAAVGDSVFCRTSSDENAVLFIRHSSGTGAFAATPLPVSREAEVSFCEDLLVALENGVLTVCFPEKS